MTRVILDASAALAILNDEPEGPLVNAAVTAWVNVGSTVTVPAQFWLEVLNHLRGTRHLAGEDLIKSIHRLDRFGIETVDFEKARLVLVADAMERHRLTAYDAEYLALAEVLAARIITLDRALGAAAGSRLVPLGPDHRIRDEPATYEGEVTWPRYAKAGRYLAELRAEALRGRAAQPG